MVARGPDVHRELVETSEGHEHRQRDARSGSAVETGSRPHLTPREAGDEILERLRERGRVGHGPVDVRFAENGPAHGHAPLDGSAAEVLDHGRGEALGELEVGQVGGAGEQRESGPRDGSCQREHHLRRAHRIDGSADDEGGSGDAGEVGAEVHGTDGIAAAGVPLVVDGGEHRRHELEQRGVGARPGGEPPFAQDRQQWRGAARAHGGGPFGPSLGRRQVG